MEAEKSNYRRQNKNFQNITYEKLFCLALMTVIPNHFTNELIKIQTNFIWKNFPSRIKDETIRK